MSELNMSIGKAGKEIPGVHWERIFYFDGADSHRVIYGHHNGRGFFAIPNLKFAAKPQSTEALSIGTVTA